MCELVMVPSHITYTSLQIDKNKSYEDETDLNKLILLVEVRHLSRAQDVIDVFEEGFIHNLGVIKQEDCGLVVHTGQTVQLLNV